MSNYIMDLRKVVGHAPLLQAGASIIVENENGQSTADADFILINAF